ncbi:MAG TPA: c-type cytochrome [Acidobacteriaceae bacterium]|nr:c-type cytochrome [Acidobacteriaceae bacterium]
MKPTTAHKIFAAGFAAWLLQAWMTIPVRSQSVAGLSQTARAGQLLFEKRCTGCHGLDTAKEGPPLRTVYGRKAGSVAGFEYSDALKNSQMVWDDSKLNQWLSNTDSLVKGNDMDFAVPKREERAEIIEYLKESSGK